MFNREALNGEPAVDARLTMLRVIDTAGEYTASGGTGHFANRFLGKNGCGALCPARFHSLLFPQFSGETAPATKTLLLRLITLISALRALAGNQVKSLRSMIFGSGCYAVKERSMHGKNRRNESSACGKSPGDDNMSYIGGHESGKKIGSMRGHTREAVALEREQEARALILLGFKIVWLERAQSHARLTILRLVDLAGICIGNRDVESRIMIQRLYAFFCGSGRTAALPSTVTLVTILLLAGNNQLVSWFNCVVSTRMQMRFKLRS